jgi:hypothetical protein
LPARELDGCRLQPVATCCTGPAAVARGRLTVTMPFAGVLPFS